MVKLKHFARPKNDEYLAPTLASLRAQEAFSGSVKRKEQYREYRE